jgi:hypothetical protein
VSLLKVYPTSERGSIPPMSEPLLVTIELRFRTSEDAESLGERIRESVRMIVGGDALEDFRLRALPLSPPQKDRHLRGV